MSNSNLSFNHEFNEFKQSLNKAMKTYSKTVEKELQSTANSLKEAIMMKERKTVSEEVSKKIEDGFAVKTKSTSQSVEVSLMNTSKEYDKAENGYESTDQNGGATIKIPGNRIGETESKYYSDQVMPVTVQNILSKIKKDCDLK